MATASAISHRRSIHVGPVELRPGTCEIIGPGGHEDVQPKVMQVLVALAEASGETVTRDDLVSRCWNARVVGDDSINRVIFKIRRLAQGVGSGAFTVKTIAKVGYRLVETPPRTAARPTAEERSPAFRFGSLPRLGLMLGALAAFLTVAAAGSWWRPAQAPRQPRSAGNFYEAAARDLAMRGAAASFESTPGKHLQAVAYFRRAIEQAPNNPALWGSLAMNLYFAAAGVPPERQGPYLADARRAGERSLKLNPREGHALAALMVLRPNFGNWIPKEEAGRRALARMDGRSPAPLYQHARLLASVGRVREALAVIEKAYALHPLVPWIAIDRINLLAASGRLDRAMAAATDAAKLWPGNDDLWEARFFLYALNGAPDRARRLAEDRNAWPEGARPTDMGLMARTAAVMASPDKRDDAAVLRDWSRLALEGQSYTEQAIRVAAHLGRSGDAIDLATKLFNGRAPRAAQRFADHDEYVVGDERPTAVMFSPPADRLWQHPRFMKLMSDIGLVDYWRRGMPPDLCHVPELMKRCSDLMPLPRHGASAG